jgi:hypothetical protein
MQLKSALDKEDVPRNGNPALIVTKRADLIGAGSRA